MAISPDDIDKPFAARWNALMSALLVEPSIKLVARQACDYGFMDGGDIFPGNERLARQTGLTERTVREAWHFLRAAGMAERIEHSAWTGARRTADRYELAIPGDWRTFPMLGPHAGKFTCQECGKQFNPSACNTWAKAAKSKVPATDKNGVRTVSWFLWKAAFCPEPRSGNGCLYHWKRANGQWGGDRAWEMYYAARGDDWPAAFPKAALPEMRSGTGSEFRQHPEVSSGTPGSEFRQHPELTSGQGCISNPHVKVESQRRRRFRSDRAATRNRGPMSALPSCPAHPRLQMSYGGNRLVCAHESHAADGSQAQAITCLRCMKTSYSPSDIREGYCGNCHDWTTPPPSAAREGQPQ